jgi:hypothetical protein
VLVLGAAGVCVAVLAPMPGGSGRSVARRVADGLTGSSPAEVPDWLAERLLGLVNKRLRPQLAFGSLSYSAPFTITLTDASLVTPEGETIVEVATLVITLAERPKRHEPLRFAGVSFDGGVVRLIVREGEAGARAGLAGFSRMLADDRPPGDPAKPGRSFSDAIELRGVEFRGFALEYHGAAGAAPLRLDHISAEMDIAPDEQDRGWYAIGFESGRAPGFELASDWRQNFDTLDSEIRSLAASIDAGPETIPTLPPALVSFMSEHEVDGRLTATGRASANLRDLAGAGADLTIEGEGLSAVFGATRLSLDGLRIAAALADRTLRLDPAQADIGGGTITVDGSANLNEPESPFGAAWGIEGVEVSGFLRSEEDADASGPPRLAGALTGRGFVRSSLRDLRGSIGGDGRVELTDGRLLVLPGLARLTETIVGEGALLRDRTPSHRGTAAFTLSPEGATITESEVVTNLIAARGTGLVSFDRTLDLRVNAGPLERIQSLLGPVGDLLGRVTDRLLKYTIKGPFDDPEVGVAPLGID